MSKYLENKICNFEILFDYNNDKKNILSACFFKMNNHYKDFKIYINGLKNIIQLLNQQNKYILRIFIDEHIKNDNYIFNLLKSNKKIEIVVFTCNNYLNNNGFHSDVFGTFLRFFPLFNFKNNDANNVILIDIDLKGDDLLYLKNLMTYQTKKKEVIGRGTTFDLLINNKTPHYFAGLLGFFNIKFNKNIIIDFIENIEEIKNNSYYSKREKSFSYGTDELFLNKYLIYNKDNKTKFKNGVLLDYNFNWFLYYSNDDLIKKYPKDTQKYLKYILDKYCDSKPNNKEMFKTIDEYMYGNNKYIDEKIILSKKFYDIIIYLKKNNKIWLKKESISLIHKYFLNIIYSISIIYFDKKSLKIEDVKHIYQVNI
jgi:hypothetical protein